MKTNELKGCFRCGSEVASHRNDCDQCDVRLPERHNAGIFVCTLAFGADTVVVRVRAIVLLTLIAVAAQGAAADPAGLRRPRRRCRPRP